MGSWTVGSMGETCVSGQGHSGLVVPSGPWYSASDQKIKCWNLLQIITKQKSIVMMSYATCTVLPHPKWHVCSFAGKCPGATEDNVCTTGMIRGMWQLPLQGQTK